MKHKCVFTTRACDICGLTVVQVVLGIEVVVVPWLKPFMSIFLKDWLAITLGKTIFAARHMTERELEHELVHVTQWQEHGSTFPLRYLWASVRAVRAGGDWYWDNEYEIEARS